MHGSKCVNVVTHQLNLVTYQRCLLRMGQKKDETHDVAHHMHMVSYSIWCLTVHGVIQYMVSYGT